MCFLLHHAPLLDIGSLQALTPDTASARRHVGPSRAATKRPPGELLRACAKILLVSLGAPLTWPLVAGLSVLVTLGDYKASLLVTGVPFFLSMHLLYQTYINRSQKASEWPAAIVLIEGGRGVGCAVTPSRPGACAALPRARLHHPMTTMQGVIKSPAGRAARPWLVCVLQLVCSTTYGTRRSEATRGGAPPLPTPGTCTTVPGVIN